MSRQVSSYTRSFNASLRRLPPVYFLALRLSDTKVPVWTHESMGYPKMDISHWDAAIHYGVQLAQYCDPTRTFNVNFRKSPPCVRNYFNFICNFQNFKRYLCFIYFNKEYLPFCCIKSNFVSVITLHAHHLFYDVHHWLHRQQSTICYLIDESKINRIYTINLKVISAGRTASGPRF